MVKPVLHFFLVVVVVVVVPVLLLPVSQLHLNPSFPSLVLVNPNMNKRVIYVHQETSGDLLREVIAPGQPFT